MRSIGRLNRLFVRLETEKAMKEEGHMNVRDLVKCRLPESLFETPESVLEVERIIHYTARDK